MPRYLLIPAAGLILFALQFSLIPLVISDPFKPNLILVAVVCMGLRAAAGWVIPLSWLLGMVQDAFSGIYPGLNAFTLLAIALILRQTAEQLYANRSNVLLFATAAATLFHALSHALFLSLFSVAPGTWENVVTTMVPQTLTNLFVASLIPLIFPGFPEDQRS